MQPTSTEHSGSFIHLLPLVLIAVMITGCGGAKKRCLVSPMTGTLLANGKPVADAKVSLKHHSHWYAERVEEFAHTDANGRFEFKGAWKKALINVPHQPVIRIEVTAEYHGTNRLVLEIGKLNYELLGELTTLRQTDPEFEKSRLSSREQKLHLTFDLDRDQAPIGRTVPLSQ